MFFGLFPDSKDVIGGGTVLHLSSADGIGRILEMETAFLEKTVEDASVGEHLKILAHSGLLAMEHLPFTLAQLHIRIGEASGKLKSSFEELFPLIKQSFLPAVKLFVFFHSICY